MDDFVRVVTYNGSVLHSSINFIILTVVLGACLVSRNTRILSHIVIVVLFISLQVVLWLVFNFQAPGVSAVWCGVAGSMMPDLVVGSRRRHNVSGSALATSAAALAIVFYGLTEPATLRPHLAIVAGGALVGTASTLYSRWRSSN